MEASLKTDLGKKVLSYFVAKAVKAAPPPNPLQIGIAGAVPQPDPAPLAGGPHTDITNVNEPMMEYVNDWDAVLFNQHASGSIADIANLQLEDGHGSNGTPYKR